jgi:hypothetical protein
LRAHYPAYECERQCKERSHAPIKKGDRSRIKKRESRVGDDARLAAEVRYYLACGSKPVRLDPLAGC